VVLPRPLVPLDREALGWLLANVDTFTLVSRARHGGSDCLGGFAGGDSVWIRFDWNFGRVGRNRLGNLGLWGCFGWRLVADRGLEERFFYLSDRLCRSLDIATLKPLGALRSE